MSDDIVVGSVAVDIVPSTRNLRRDIQAKAQGISVDIGVNADTTGVRAQIESASRSRPANIRVKVDDAAAKAQLAALQNKLKDQTLALDLSTADAKAKVATLQAQIAVVKARTDLDTDEAKAKIAALQVQAKDIRAKMDIDTAPARAEVAQLRTEVAAQRIKVKIEADAASAEAELDTVARDRTSTIRANVDKSQVSAVGKLQESLSGISGFALTMIALGPALIPILAVVGGLGLALAAPLAIAGGGATVFGFLAGFAVKDTAKQLKAIADQRKKLGELTKGTKEYADANADLKVLVGGLSPAQKKFSDALDHIKGSFAELLGGKTGGELLGPISAFLNLTADVLPKLAPIISAVSGALTDLLGDLGKAVQGPDFKNFIDAFSKQVGPDIEAFGHIAGGVFKGVAGLVVSLGDAFGPGLLKGIETLTDNFANFGQQAGNAQKLQDFIGYVKRIGPQVGDTIGAVARGIGHVVEALAPLGPPALKAIEGIANAISGIPIPVLTGMAAAFIAVAGAAKVGKGLSALGLLGGGGLGKSGGGGILGNLIGTAKPVPVFVTNPGFGGGGGGGVPVVAGAAGRAAAESEAVKAAAAAAAAVRAAGGGAASQSSAAARAFKEAMAAHDAAVLKNALDFGIKGGARGLLGTLLAAPAGITLGGAGHENPHSETINGHVIDLTNVRPASEFPTPERLKSTATHIDALRNSIAGASRTIDLIGPHADDAFGQASKDVDRFSAKLDALHDKKIAVILNDLAAVQSLKALQAFRLKDKTLTVHVEQELDRVVGPSGGIGHPLGASAGGGAGRNFTPSAAPSSGSGAGASGPLVNVGTVYARDLNDLLRESDKASRQRSGGGVILTGAPR